MDESAERPPLRFWQRFPVRLMGAFGITSLALFGVLAAWFYRVQADSALEGLQARILILVVELSVTLDGNDVHDLPPEIAAAYWTRVRRQMRVVGTIDPSVDSLYVLRLTDDEGIFEFLADYAATGDAAEYLERYDGRHLPMMLRGTSSAVVEDKLYRDDWGWSLSAYAPVRDRAGRTVAIVGADVDAAEIHRMRARVRTGVLAAFALAVVAFVLLTWFTTRRVDRPLGTILDASDAVARGDLEARVDLDRADEFGLIARSFNKMVEGLQERERVRDILGRYVSKQLADAVLDGHDSIDLSGMDLVCTVLFSDLRGYSTISESAAPSEVLLLLNEYLQEMNTIIEDNGGTVVEFLGDGIMAVFGAPFPLADHPEKAVRCAVEMRTRLDVLNRVWGHAGRAEMWRSVGIDRVRARVGIHSGHVVAGNLGGTHRMKYGLIGDTVNIAARLEQLNKVLGTDIAITEATAEALPEGSFDLVSQGQHNVKGRGKPVEVYTL